MSSLMVLLQLLSDVYSEEIESLRELINASNDLISNDLSSINTVLTVASLVISIACVLFGMYVTYLSNRMKKMKDAVDVEAGKIKETAAVVKDTDAKIQSDISGLYKKLQKEETISLLHRLEEEPLDIGNLAKQLLARTIDDDCYGILKNAFMNLIDLYVTAEYYQEERKDYLLLFFQHFTYLSIKDDDIRPLLILSFSNDFQCAFKRDINVSTKDLCRALSEKDASFDKESVLVEYLKALNKSKYKSEFALKNILSESIQNQCLLPNALDRCRKEGEVISLFETERFDGNEVEPDERK